jgi:sulfur carrier protein ThiS
MSACTTTKSGVKQMERDQFVRILAFLRQLEQAKIAYELRHSRDDAIIVRTNVPGERWEVEFLQDDDVEIERFISGGEIHDESMLQELFARFSDAPSTNEEAVNENDTLDRK